MEKQELQQIYDLCIDEFARYTLAGVQVSPELLGIITKLEEDMRNKDILEAMDRIQKSGPNISLHTILDKQYLKLNSQNYVNLMYNKDLFYYLLQKNTQAADFTQPKAARPSFESSQYIEEKLAEMASPRAAELTEATSVQYKK